MAERRMFAKSIVLSDAFLDMPLSARCLYFTLGMLADDDGFIGSPKAIMRQCGATQDDMLILLQKRFVLSFESGVIVIKHWKINNYLRNDRYSETNYKEELAQLMLNQNNAYTEKKEDGIPTVYQRYTQDSIGKDRLGKDSIRESKPARHKYGQYFNVLLSDDELETWKAECPQWLAYINDLSGYMTSSGKGYKNHLATLRNWYRRDKEQGKVREQKQASYDLEKETKKAIDAVPVYERRKK